MKKRVLAGVACAMFICSVGLAAPVINLEKGESLVGYTWSRLDFEGDKENFNGLFLQSAVGDKFILGIDYLKGSGIDFKETDIYGQYKFDQNARLILGNRQYKIGGYDENKLLYGIAANTQLAENTLGYASLLRDSLETDWKVGVAYEFAANTSLDLNYRYRDIDDGDSIKGFGLGLNYKF